MEVFGDIRREKRNLILAFLVPLLLAIFFFVYAKAKFGGGFGDEAAWVLWGLGNALLCVGLFAFWKKRIWSAYQLYGDHMFDTYTLVAHHRGSIDENGYIVGRIPMLIGAISVPVGMVSIAVAVWVSATDSTYDYLGMLALEPVFLILFYYLVKTLYVDYQKEYRFGDKVARSDRYANVTNHRERQLKDENTRANYSTNARFCPQCATPHADDPDLTHCSKCGRRF